MKKILALMIFLLVGTAVHAFELQTVANSDNSLQNPVLVQNPEDTKAYNGDLNGKPDFYRMVSDNPFEMYINILVPNVTGVNKNFFVIVENASGQIALLDGTIYQWTEFTVPYSSDVFLRGPEFRLSASPGNYSFSVFSTGMKGAYVLAAGEKLSVSPGDAAAALLSSPQSIKVFGVPVLYIIIIVVVIIILLILALILKKRKKKGVKTTKPAKMKVK